MDCHSDSLLGPHELTGELYDPLEDMASTDYEETQDSNKYGHPEAVKNTPCFEGTRTIFMKLTSYSYTAAVLAVGIGFAYMYLKYQ